MRYFLFILISLSLFFSCKSDTKQVKELSTFESIEGVGDYVSAFTEQEIGKQDPIVIRFAQAAVDEDLIGQEVSSELYDIHPRVAAKVYWKNRYNLHIEPETQFASGEQYDVSLNLRKIFPDAPASLAQVTQSFKVKQLKLSLQMRPMTVNTLIGSDYAAMDGVIRSSDLVSLDEIKNVVEAKQKGNSELDIIWTIYSSKHYEFTVEKIKKKAKESELILTYNGAPMDPSFKGEKRFIVFKKDDFQLNTSRVVASGDRYIELSFTDIVDPAQDLQGLLRIKNYKGDLDVDRNGNILKIYPSKAISGNFELIVDSALRSKSGQKLGDEEMASLSFDPVKPQVRLVGEGVIVPNNDRVIFPFESVNLSEVQVEVFKIYQNNVLQYLQSGNLNYGYQLHQVGSIIHKEKVYLNNVDESRSDRWTRQILDLAKLIKVDPGAIYQVRIGFSKNGIISYPCTTDEKDDRSIASTEDGMESMMDRRVDYNYYEQREDPCHGNYYTGNRFIKRNVLASNLGAIVKKGQDGQLVLAVSDLRSLKPLSGVQADFYDYQQQKITDATTGNNGVVELTTDKKTSFVILKEGSQYGYVNLQDHYANSLSEFNVSGNRKKSGIDGFIYGDRGVWRPGDTLFLNFVLEDKLNKLPENHPVQFTVKDSRGRTQYKESSVKNIGGIYPFTINTDVSTPTGNWTATARVGASVFQKTIKVETVKPNRLKIIYSNTDHLVNYKDQKINLSSEWLTGAQASGLKAKVDLTYAPVSTYFEKYKTYFFDDIARRLSVNSTTAFDGRLDNEGNAVFNLKKSKNWNPPGRVSGLFKTKVFEPGGNFSEDYFKTLIDPYESYVGVKINERLWGRNYLPKGQSVNVPIVSVDKEGNPISGKKLEVGIYRAKWRWWYDRGASSRYRYNSTQHTGALLKESVITDANGKANFETLFSDYGSYMIRVCDTESGHCTGQMFYTGYGSAEGQEAPKTLSFKTDKDEYVPGEDMTIDIPSTAGSKVFVSIENGTKVLQNFWLDGKKDILTIKVPVDAEMTPNVYVHIHALQPHNDGKNDLALRMYGVVPIKVVDPATQIVPEINMPDELKPNQVFTIEISEKRNREMYYTIDVVDEGLLDLTRYKTPDLWNHFYAKQALGVKTWDIYDYVLDGYGGSLDQFITVGGDGSIIRNDKSKKANRFVPVVRHIGPFKLAAGQKATHEISMPNYVGSVRTMVVARNGDAYGSAEKTTKVKKPLMVLATLPRVLGPGEELSLPAQVFAMDDKIKNVNVQAELGAGAVLSGTTNQDIQFSKMGDQLVDFNIKVGDKVGPLNVKLSASGNDENSYDEIDINIRNPMPFSSEVEEKTLQPGESWDNAYSLFGVEGTNEGYIEISKLPPINLNKRLNYLLRYPYGCLEQTTSAVFPQLYLDKLTDMTPLQERAARHNMIAAINKINQMERPGGGFSYWPGRTTYNSWANTYAGHFLLEAKNIGFFVNDGLIERWAESQQKAARSYKTNTSNKYSAYSLRLNQAYRLYSLTLAGEPEVGAMNRLRQEPLSVTTKLLLAACYARIGKKEIAEKLVDVQNFEPESYDFNYYTYGSGLRNRAMILTALMDLDRDSDAAVVAKEVARKLGGNRWYSTHTTGWCLIALSRFVEKYGSDDIVTSWNLQGQSIDSERSNKGIVQKDIDVSKENSFSVKNESSAVLFARLILSGQRAPSTDIAPAADHLKMTVKYMDESGNPIDMQSLKQGTDFIARVDVRNVSNRYDRIDNIALKQIFPSGWEIQNDRLSGDTQSLKNSSHEHREIRDDRVFTFFNLSHSETKTFYVRLTATYAGKFFLPPMRTEAMYNDEVFAQNSAQWVRVSQDRD